MNRTNDTIAGRPLRSLALLLLLAATAACSREQTEPEAPPAGKVRVEVALAGVAGGISPWQGSGSGATPPSVLAEGFSQGAGASAGVPYSRGGVLTRAGEGQLPYALPWPGYDQHDLNDKGSSYYNGAKYNPLPKGETLRLIVCKTDGTIIEQKTYLVGDGGSLYPCTVHADGTPDDSGDTPLYLAAGDYLFYALSPARELGGNGIQLRVDNGDYLLSNDWRYTQTEPTKLQTADFEAGGNRIVRLQLNALINQTARLKFSFYTDDDNLHDLLPSDAGLWVSGLQEPYDNEGNTGKDVLNWAVGDTLRMAYGHKNAQDIAYTYSLEKIKVPQKDEATGTTTPVMVEKDALVIATSILPTDATSRPLVVMFRGKINGIPTTHSMMLNEKSFRAGFSYNYVGRVKMKDGVAAIEWQVVAWEADIYIGVGNGDAGTGGVPIP